MQVGDTEIVVILGILILRWYVKLPLLLCIIVSCVDGAIVFSEINPQRICWLYIKIRKLEK